MTAPPNDQTKGKKTCTEQGQRFGFGNGDGNSLWWDIKCK